jgi:hypothetical protein
VKVSEYFFGPQIDPSLARISMSEFDNGDSLRPEEKQQRHNPQPDSDPTIGRNRGHDVEIKNGDYKKKYEVEATENALQMRSFGIVISGQGDSVNDGLQDEKSGSG